MEYPGQLKGRKRLQKIVCISQYSKKYPGFKFEFVRHYYGPYSFDLRRLMDRLVSIGFVEENYEGLGYTYKITEKGKVFYKTKAKSDLNKLKLLRKFIKEELKGQHISTLIRKSKEVFGW